MKSAYEVLPSREIDSSLAADRGIDLRQQGCGHLRQRQSAQVNRRAEAGEIANHTAAQRHDEIVSFKAIFTEKSDSLFQNSERLVALSFRHQPLERLKARGFQRAHDV